MQGLFSLIPLIVFLPFLGVVINAFFGRMLMPTRTSKAPGVLASIMSGLAFLIAVLMFAALLGHPEGAEVPFLTFLSIPVGERLLYIPWTFKVDTLSTVMMLVVTGVGTLIHVYAIGYMDYDVDVKAHEWGVSPAEALDMKRRRFSRFFTYMNLFLGSMLILVTGNNYFMLFVGWELVGLCSFLLIGFWYDDPHRGWSNAAAARKAFVVNRVGDFGMLLAIFLMFWSFGSLQFDEVFVRAECMITESQEHCLTLSAADAPQEEEDEGEHGSLRAVFASTSLMPAAHDGEPEPPYLTPIQIGIGTLALSTVVTAMTLLMLLGATGKSAQIPLFVWLPDAMAGPTPVSALIHAATMVTAGVYMITRSNVFFHMAPISGTVVAYVGGATALVAATIALAQFDIKRVLAFSTISQLGFMVAAVGVGGYIAGIFHLATHAFFKALLFLGSGSVIQGVERGLLGDALSHADHSTHGHDEHHVHDDPHEEHAHPDPQDMRNMGGLLKRMPLTGWTYIIGSIALAGIVPFAGFWSKDEILLDTSLENFPVYVMLSVAAMFTAFYMTRQVFMVFFGKPRTAAAAKASESAMTVTIPLMALAFLAFFGGFMNLPISGWHHLGGWLEESVKYAHIGEFSIQVAAISTVVALVAILGGWLIYGRQPMEEGEADPLQAVLGPIFTFLNRKWYWDEVYAALLVRPYTRLGTFLAETVDWAFWHDFVHDSIIWEAFKGWAAILSRPVERGIVDGAVNGIAQMIGVSSGQMRKAQTGYVRNYALVIGLGVVLILGFLAVALVLG